MTFFSPSDQVVVRDVARNGFIHRVVPFTVVEDTRDMTVLFAPGGTRYMRGVAKKTGHKGPWMLKNWVPGLDTLSRDSLRFQFPATWYSVHYRWGYEPWRWYVNFERAYSRRDFGFDTCDLELDITVDSGLSWRWKDRAEYDEACRLGLITKAEQNNVSASSREVIQRLTNRVEPFTEHWSDWSADPAWLAPQLPTDSAIVPPVDQAEPSGSRD